jgi:hypothetical protein
MQLYLESQVAHAGTAAQTPQQAYLATRVVGTLLQEELSSFDLEDDPEALSEILMVRQKYASDLQEFRATMAKATNEWRLVESEWRDLPGKVQDYVESVRPSFEHTRRALSESMRVPKLILRRGGALISVGACAGAGALLGTSLGPAGIVAGAAKGAAIGAGIGAAASEALKSIFAELGKETAEAIKSKSVSIDKSTVYLFHAQKAL